MALATQCPHCATTFRVASDQLKLRGGIVRCGACQEIFDGNATLIDLDALAAATPPNPEAVPEVAEAPVGAAEVSAPPPETDTAAVGMDDAAIEAATAAEAIVPAGSAEAQADSVPIYTLDFDSTFDPFGILPKPEAPEAIDSNAEAAEWSHAEVTETDTAPEAGPSPALEPAHPVDADLPIDEELIAAPLLGDDLHDTEPPAVLAAASEAPAARPLPMRPATLGSDHPYAPAASIPPRAGVRAKAGRRSKLTPTKIAPPKLRVPEIDEPEFVKRSRQQEQTGRTRRILMAAGSAVLLFALAAQVVTTFRNVLAARFPAAKPALVAACSLLGCRVQLPAQIDNLAIETGELQTLGPNAYSLTTQLRNNGDLVQAWPSIELALTDANDKPLLRRVFTPAEYLGPGARAAAGFAPRAEQPVKLQFELDQLTPSGYHIAVFYP